MKTTLNQRIKAVTACIAATEKKLKETEHKGADTVARHKETLAALNDVLQDLKDTKYLGAPARNISVQPLIFDQP
jgi:putative NIF3 family GTP cyclohydrolase 1 type 2